MGVYFPSNMPPSGRFRHRKSSSSPTLSDAKLKLTLRNIGFFSSRVIFIADILLEYSLHSSNPADFISGNDDNDKWSRFNER